MKKTFHHILLFLAILIMSENIQAQDWANLNRYETENAVAPLKKSSEKRVVLMGDSITEFWLKVQPEFFDGKPYLDRGISGQTTPQMLLRFRADVINLNPDVVVLLAGINDIAGNTGPTTTQKITNNIVSMIELAKANQIQVILCSVLPAKDFYWKPNPNAVQSINELNQFLQNYAKTHQIPYVDYYAAMVDAEKGLPKEYSEDGVHPNKKGYQIMASLLEKAIEKVLSK